MRHLISALLSSSFVLMACAFLGLSQTPPAKPNLPSVQQPAKTDSTPKPPSVVNEKEPNPENAALTSTQRVSVELLREAGDEASAVKEKFRAAMLQAKIADRLWRYDKDAARKLFDDAFTAAEQYVKDGERSAQANPKLKRDTARQQDVRMVVIRLYTRHDEAEGKRLLERYLADKKQEQRRRSYTQLANDPMATLLGSEYVELDEMLAAAISMVEINRPLAVQIGQQALQQTASMLASPYFFTLANVNRAEADTLFVQTLADLSRHPLNRPGTLFALAPYAFGENSLYLTDGKALSYRSIQVPQNYKPSAAVSASFLQTALVMLGRFAEPNSAQRPTANSILGAAYYFVLRYETQVAQWAPALSQAWLTMKNRLAALAQDEARNSVEAAIARRAEEQNGMLRRGDDVQTLLQRAANAPDLTTRDKLYQEAAFSLKSEQNYSEALSVARKISALDFRRGTESWINFDAAQASYKDEKFEEARKYAEEVTELELRAYLLIQTAAAALKQENLSLAGEIARLAANAADNASNSVNKVRVSLAIAFVYEEIEASRAFDYLNDAIKAMNQLSEDDAYEAERDRIERNFLLPNGKISQELVARGMSLEVTLPQLARHDGFRALSLARDCRDHATRAVALFSLGSMGLKD